MRQPWQRKLNGGNLLTSILVNYNILTLITLAKILGETLC